MTRPNDDRRWELVGAKTNEDWERFTEGPFLMGQAQEAVNEAGGVGATGVIPLSEAMSSSEAFGELATGYTNPMIVENPPGQHLLGRKSEDLAEPDPYMAIRPALSPEHAEMTADEIAVSFGGLPAIVSLHQALASPEPQRAALAVLLGSAGRRSTRVHGHNMPIPAYLRLLSRLCREAAEQGEQELEASNTPGPAIRDLTNGCTGPDVREVQKALNTRAKAALDPDGVFGPRTRGAVIAFQRANDLQSDGIVGRQTRHVLFPLVGVTVHAVGWFGAETSATVASRESGETPPFAMEDPPGPRPATQVPTDNIWRLLIPNLPKADPADGTLDTFHNTDAGLDLPIPPLLTAPLLNISGMKLDSRQVQPGFQLNTAPLWQSRSGSPNPSGTLVLAFQSVLALHKEKPGHLEVTEGFQVGRPVFAKTSDGRDWTLQWFAQATWVDPFWQRGRWHLVQPFAQFSTQLDLKTEAATLGLGAFPVNVQVDIIKDKLSVFMQGGIVTSWDLGGGRIEIGAQAIGGLNITLGGK